MILEEISSQKYQEYLDQTAYAEFLQAVEQGNRMEKQGWSVEYVRAVQNGEVKAAAMLCMIPLMKIFRYCYIPRGFFCDYHDRNTVMEFTSLLKDHLNRKNVVYMEMDPAIILKERDKNGDIVEGGVDNSDIVENLKQAGFQHLPLTKGYDDSKQCRWVSVLDLSNKDEKQLFKEFSNDTRRNIRTTEKLCVRIKEMDRDGLKLLDDMEKRTSERQQFEKVDIGFYDGLIEAFGKENVFIPCAYLDIKAYRTHLESEFERLSQEVEQTKAQLEENPSVSKQKKLKNDTDYLNSLQKKLVNAKQMHEKHGDTLPVAAAFYVIYKQQMYYLVSASEYEFRSYKGPYAIQWHMIRKAKQLGCNRYNFYGISGYFNEGEEGYGVFDFKRGFNATIEEYIGNFILPIKPVVYNTYKGLKKNR